MRGTALALALALAVAFAPLPLEPTQQRMAALAVFVLTQWVTEALPLAVTALLVAPGLVILGITTPKVAFAPYADPLLFLFVGSFFIAAALSRHGLDRRIANAVMALPALGASPRRARLTLALLAAGLSAWISNTATTAMLLPIALGAFAGSERRVATGGVLAVAWAASAGGLATLVGSPPNLITARFLHEQGVAFGFLDWALVGAPTAVGVVAAAVWITGRAWPAPESPGAAPDLDKKPVGRAGWAILACFALAILGWSAPDLLTALGHPWGPPLAARLDPGTVALLASAPLFVARDEAGHRVLDWEAASRIDWGVILLFGGGISLGKQLFDTGLAELLGRAFLLGTGVTDLWVLTALVVVFTLFFTELCSNTATANMLAPLVVGVALALGVSPVPPVLGVGLAASCAFMLPVATGPNALAASTGAVTQGQMMRGGLPLNLLAAVWIWLVLRVVCPWMGWDAPLPAASAAQPSTSPSEYFSMR